MDKNFSCGKCETMFTRYQDRNRHRKWCGITDIDVVYNYCNWCGKKFKRKDSLARHLRKYCPNKKGV